MQTCTKPARGTVCRGHGIAVTLTVLTGGTRGARRRRLTTGQRVEGAWGALELGGETGAIVAVVT